ncbi:MULTISPECIES: phosphoadenosine phosphosulfate reductase domain-containing protein [Vibrio]|uniref:phosphoadenosine phosphosulfate reductase domain-containing protein n=1 Tax=Vibrio TaxID=662 RepID=UPI00078BA375|nr:MULTISPECIES: phosphoadenosine phosphosulfate reductase family protein [Vibrio]BAU71050.1 hypothetical protein [Vibrio sp. 04Ya108]BBM67690.1 hypothetical protein VA249_43360 [Vibrio alfacsensis]BCN27187.1 hypothetical protein VYA_43790 [Vibrio alfacsensis]
MGSGYQVDMFDDLTVIPSLAEQLLQVKKGGIIHQQPADPFNFYSAKDIDLSQYDVAVVASSSGKDSLCMIKRLLDLGFPKEKIEIIHHIVDGRGNPHFMDWPFIEDMTKKIGEALGIKTYFSWLDGGFKQEMLKENCQSKPIVIETPEGFKTINRVRQKPGTRRMFPQTSGSLLTRWCSSACKIEVGNKHITHQDRFLGKNVLMCTGERREESPGRAKFQQLIRHSADTMRGSKNPRKPRIVDQWRPILHLSEEDVWQILADWRFISPVPYRLSWPRSSCMTCIFNGPKIWSTIYHHWPDRVHEIAEYEKEFGVTICRTGQNILERALSTSPLEIDDSEALAQAMDTEYKLPLFNKPEENWELPPGAFASESAGAI